jgi:hypothetical protein
MSLTISCTGKSVLIYRIFLHQYLPHVTWSHVGGSKIELLSDIRIDTVTTASTNK